jgi:hypothetical protein
VFERIDPMSHGTRADQQHDDADWRTEKKRENAEAIT